MENSKVQDGSIHSTAMYAVKSSLTHIPPGVPWLLLQPPAEMQQQQQQQQQQSGAKQQQHGDAACAGGTAAAGAAAAAEVLSKQAGDVGSKVSSEVAGPGSSKGKSAAAFDCRGRGGGFRLCVNSNRSWRFSARACEI